MTVAQCMFKLDDTRCAQVATFVLATACVHEHRGDDELCTLHGTVVLQSLSVRDWACIECDCAPGDYSHRCQLALVTFLPLAPLGEIDPTSPGVLIA